MTSNCSFGVGLIFGLDSATKRISFGASAFFLTAFAAISNVFVIYASRRSKKVFGFWLCSLALTDIFTAVFTMPITAAANIGGFWDMGPQMCKASF